MKGLEALLDHISSKAASVSDNIKDINRELDLYKAFIDDTDSKMRMRISNLDKETTEIEAQR